MQRYFIGLGKSHTRRVEAALAGDASKAGGATISGGLLAASHKGTCKCEDVEHMVDLIGVGGILYPGMLVSELRPLGAGCTSARRGEGLNGPVRGVCARLASLRRHYDV